MPQWAYGVKVTKGICLPEDDLAPLRWMKLNRVLDNPLLLS